MKPIEAVKRLPQRVRDLRHAKGLTQREVAARGRCEWASLNRLERHVHQPTLRLVEKVAQGLGCSPSDLFHRGPADWFLWEVSKYAWRLTPSQRIEIVDEMRLRAAGCATSPLKEIA